MKSAEEALEALSRLCGADREWLLTALSGNARARLLRLATSERGPSESERAPGLVSAADARESGSGAEAMLDAAPMEKIASALESEPTWVMAVLLGTRAWRWEEHLLGKLAPDQRHEVVRLRATLPQSSPKMREALTRALWEQVSEAAARPEIAFEQILRRARPRVRRRGWAMEIGT